MFKTLIVAISLLALSCAHGPKLTPDILLPSVSCHSHGNYVSTIVCEAPESEFTNIVWVVQSLDASKTYFVDFGPKVTLAIPNTEKVMVEVTFCVKNEGCPTVLIFTAKYIRGTVDLRPLVNPQDMIQGTVN